MSLIANEDPNLAESRFDRISNAPPTNYAVRLSGINRKFLSSFFFFFLQQFDYTTNWLERRRQVELN